MKFKTNKQKQETYKVFTKFKNKTILNHNITDKSYIIKQK